MSKTVTCVWPVGAILGEGPCWHQKTGRLFFLDINGKRLFRLTPESDDRSTWDLPIRVGSIAPVTQPWQVPSPACDGVFIAGTQRGFAWLMLEGNKARLTPFADPEPHFPGNRFNDGKMGPDGRFYAGTMDDAEQQTTGSLYALSPDLTVMPLDKGYKVTNGPTFSPSGDLVYHNDSARQTIYRFRLGADGLLHDKEVFRQFGAGDGYPDGMTTDSVGNLYVAMWDGWRIEVINPQGETIDHIEFPVARITSCTFADKNEQRLYVTSASIGIDTTEQPLAGGLFAVDM